MEGSSTKNIHSTAIWNTAKDFATIANSRHAFALYNTTTTTWPCGDYMRRPLWHILYDSTILKEQQQLLTNKVTDWLMHCFSFPYSVFCPLTFSFDPRFAPCINVVDFISRNITSECYFLRSFRYIEPTDSNDWILSDYWNDIRTGIPIWYLLDWLNN